MKKINFFLAGFPKSATTSVASILDKHPNICFSRPKEPDLFLENSNINADYLFKIFEHGTQDKLKGEGSQRYSIRDRFPNVAKNIYNHNPNAKLVFIARHPLERAISHFMMIDRDVDLNITINEVFNDDWLKYNVVNTSKYFYQISPFIDYFPKEQILILWFEDFVFKKEYFLSSLYSFLEIKAVFPTYDVKENSSTNFGRTTKLYRCLNQNLFYNSIKKAFPLKLRDKYRKFLNYKFGAKRKYQLNETFKKKFVEYIADDMNDFISFSHAPDKIREYYSLPHLKSANL